MARAVNAARAWPKSSGSRRRLRRAACASRGSTTRTFPSRRGCCRQRRARTSPPSTRLPASPTTSPTRASASTDGAARAARRLARAPARGRRRAASRRTTPTPPAIFVALGETMRRCDLDVAALRRSAQRVSPGRGRSTRYETWDDLLDYCRRSANPVGRLVLRIAGLSRRGSSTRGRTRSARRCSSRTSGRTSRSTGARAALYVPLAVVRAAGADDAGSRPPAMSPEWQRGARRRRRPHARAASTRAGRSPTACAAGCAGSCARPGSAACASSTGSSARGFDVFRSPADARLGGRRRRSPVAHARAGRRRDGRRHDAKDQLLLLVSRPAGSRSAARSRPSSTSAARWTTRRSRDRIRRARRRRSTSWRAEVARVFDGRRARDAAGRRRCSRSSSRFTCRARSSTR